mgnify:CR=1 FL=1
MALVRLAVALVMLAPALPATGQTRPVAASMRCGDVQKLVSRSGPLLLHFTEFTYDVVGRDPSFCGRRQSDPLYIPTTDSAQCLAGYVCSNRSR